RQLRESAPPGVHIPDPQGYRWVPYKDEPGHPSRGEILVATPEQPLKKQLAALDKKGVSKDSEEYRAVQKKLDDTVRDEVFKGDELVSTDIHHQNLQTVVFFEFKTARKPFF